MIGKNVSEMAHDKYIQHINELLRKDNPSVTDYVVRRGEDVDFIGKRQCISSINHR